MRGLGEDQVPAFGAADVADVFRDANVGELGELQGADVAVDDLDALGEAEFLDEGACLRGGGLEKLDGVDLACPGLDAEAGKDGVLAAADVDDDLVADGAVHGFAEFLVAGVVVSHRLVKGLVEELLAAGAGGGGPEFHGVGALRDDVGYEAFRAVVLACDHGAFPDAGLALERGLDLRGLDALAADLDLVVGSAEVLELAGVGPADDVARFVNALAVDLDEVRGGEVRSVPITARELRAADVQLPAGAGGGG